MIILLFLVIWVIKPDINMLLLFRIMFFLMEMDKSGKGGQEVQNLWGVIPKVSLMRGVCPPGSINVLKRFEMVIILTGDLVDETILLK